MKYLIPFLILVILTISSCNQLYRAIPKAPRHKVVLTEQEIQNKQHKQELSLNEVSSNENEMKPDEELENSRQTDEEKMVVEKSSTERLKTQEQINSESIVKDTLFVDADVLRQGESCVRLQTVVNVGTSLTFILFYLSIIFIGLGIYNIYKYNNLPYVSQETDIKMQRKIKNFYIALGIYLLLILLIVALIFFL